MTLFEKKRILITGGAGFLGSHLCEKLINEGNEVICLDNFYNGNLNNIRGLFNHKNFYFVEDDILNFDTNACGFPANISLYVVDGGISSNKLTRWYASPFRSNPLLPALPAC